MILDIQDIINSVSVPALIKDDFVRKGSFLRLRNGDPQVYVGGFSVVFPVEVNGTKWAFRCWHRTIDEGIDRIKQLSIEIKEAKLNYLLNYDFVQSGITVGGRTYPTTRMQWIDGITIKEYLCNNRYSRSKLEKLAGQFLRMIKDMHQHSFAHGDLQHGNIIVNDVGNLYLVDYDSFYCPKFKDEPDIITGLKDYQHPARKTNGKTSEKIDYFSELIIYISILGIAYNPSLVEKYQIEESDHMLFESSDFDNIKQSKIYKDLYELNPIFPVLLNILEQYLSKKTINDLVPFDTLMEQMTKAPEIKSFTYSPLHGIYVGDKIKLSWLIDGAMYMYINSKSIKSMSCERTVSFPGKNTYTLKIANDFHETQKALSVDVFAIPEIVFSANKDTLQTGSSEDVLLSWRIQNASKVSLCHDDVCEEVADIGTKKVQPQTTTKYTLKIIGKDNKRVFEKDLTIGVYSPAEVSFTADKDIVLSCNPVSLSWHVDNALSVELQGNGSVNNVGNIILKPKKDITYKLIVTDHFGRQEYKLDVKTLPLPIIKFESSSYKLNCDKKEKAKISWDIKNAKDVQLDFIGTHTPIKEKGSKTIHIDESADLVLKCTALDEETIYEEKIHIDVFKEARIHFTSDRKYTIPEVPVELSWDVENSKVVELKGYGKVPAKGSKEVAVGKETSFILIVTDEFSTREQSVLVKMLPLPEVKSLIIPMPELNKPFNVTVSIPKPDIKLSFPQISLPNINFMTPAPPNMDNVSEFISNETRPSLFSEIKSLFYYFFNK